MEAGGLGLVLGWGDGGRHKVRDSYSGGGGEEDEWAVGWGMGGAGEILLT